MDVHDLPGGTALLPDVGLEEMFVVGRLARGVARAHLELVARHGRSPDGATRITVAELDGIEAVAGGDRRGPALAVVGSELRSPSKISTASSA